MRLLLLTLLLCCALPVGAGAQVTVHIDPVQGMDRPGHGTAGQPFRSLSYAVGQTVGVVSPRFLLRPGRYGPANGEQFPLQLPDLCRVEVDDRVIAPDSHAVVLDPSQGGGAAFLIAPRSVGLVTLRGLSVPAGRLLEIQARSATSLPTVTVEHCTAQSLLGGGAAVGVAATVDSGALLTLTLRDCEFRSDGRGCLAIDLAANSAYQLRVDRCRLVGGDHVVDLDAWDGGFGAAAFRSCEIIEGGLSGIRSASAADADLVVRLEHVLVADCGHDAQAPAAGAGLLVSHSGVGPFPSHDIVNSILTGNTQDAPLGGRGCSFGANLVEQRDLGTLGANQLGTPSFVDSAAGNRRLRPRSLGVDAGDVTRTTLFADRDGEPRGLGGDRVDLGPDEMHLHSVHLQADPRAGSLWDFVVRTSPHARFGLLVGAFARSGRFGPGIPHLDGPTFGTPLVGTADQDGIGRATLPVPADPALTGLALHWQAIVDVPPYWGANAWRTVIRP